MKKTLYKLDTKGKLREWTVEVQGAQYRFITGLVDGKKVTSGWTVASPKNIGRSNETTAEEQALQEAESEIQFHRDDHYHDTPEEAQSISKPFTPMLANRYDSWQGKVFSQPKLDGIRCNASVSGLRSRGNKDIVAVPHIHKALLPIFKQFGADIVFDGELYNHDLKDDFNKITSLVKKQKLTSSDFLESEKMVQYHIYDVYIGSQPTMPFNDRLLSIMQFFAAELPPCIEIVQTTYCDTEDSLDSIYQEYLAFGYEGQMIRDLSAPYEQKRSKNLLKRKPLYEDGGNDTELEIISIEEGAGNWFGKAKVVNLKLDENRNCKATIKGTMSYLEKVLQEKDKYVGKKATIQYQNLTPDGIPRFPVAIELDRGDY